MYLQFYIVMYFFFHRQKSKIETKVKQESDVKPGTQAKTEKKVPP